jgi:D-3-phosphoglycerate dehydrogenase
MVPTAVNVAPVSQEVMEKVGPTSAWPKTRHLARRHGGVNLDILTIGTRRRRYALLRTAAIRACSRASDEASLRQRRVPRRAARHHQSETQRSETQLRLDAGPACDDAARSGRDRRDAHQQKDEPRIITMLGYELDMAPSKNMAFFLYKDRPGVIGKIGTIVGEAGVNIATMDVGRMEAGGTALMGINLDSPLLPEIVEQIGKALDVQDAWYVEL